MSEIDNAKCWPHYPPTLTIDFVPTGAESTATRDYQTKVGVHGFLEMENQSVGIQLTIPPTSGMTSHEFAYRHLLTTV